MGKWGSFILICDGRLVTSGDSSSSEPQVTLPPSLAAALDEGSEEEMDEWMGDWE